VLLQGAHRTGASGPTARLPGPSRTPPRTWASSIALWAARAWRASRMSDPAWPRLSRPCYHRGGSPMFDMQVWQLAVVAIVAVVSLAWMSRAILRLTLSPASGQGTVRKATAIESALVGGVVPEGAQVFDGWAYRVGARFAGRVRIAVYS